ncbi:anhydro-N-acetylmuramic acid kinase [Pedobacter flavus]|uniref:Anhydro-N-acetylmuramic acid kinase n=1 Tax=Pedobacter flavus TaxID=3113906 RepID=A0ABU7GZV9_9SPHI|nr:anhydro-N-acetylmuramic acid kinase [Pedobacter sp. VNH31]MEE1884606.1 anhydro-N-acetylmuramic acid kinase [Pedobacter sp. VNH31]
MNLNIAKIYDIANKSKRLIIGLMSGTSMDGLDIALCSIEGSGVLSKLKILEFKTADYDEEFRKNLKSIFSNREADLQKVVLMNELVAIKHAKLVNDAIEEWKVDKASIDLIASHGQTIFHAPKSFHQDPNFPNATFQIGDGDHIAVNTGIITISDFRQKHVACGGEGAPLALYGDYLIFGDPKEDRVLLNIGGISNFTFLPGNEQIDKVFSTDVGPGNTLMDQFVFREFGLFYDKDADLASKGKVNDVLLSELLNHPFFLLEFPKTTGPELFNLDFLDTVLTKTELVDLSPFDILATLNNLTAQVIVNAIQITQSEKSNIFISGGGLHNPLLINTIKNLLPTAHFSDLTELAVIPDAKEAALFAILANEAVAGKAIPFKGQNMPKTTFGKISFPT